MGAYNKKQTEMEHTQLDIKMIYNTNNNNNNNIIQIICIYLKKKWKIKTIIIRGANINEMTVSKIVVWSYLYSLILINV